MRPPPSTADLPGPRPSGCPPAHTGEQQWGTGGEQWEAPPPSPPPPSPPPSPRRAGGQPGGRRPRNPLARPGEAPPERAAAPGEGCHRAGTPRAPRQPPAHSHSTRGRPAALRRYARASRGPHPGSGTRTRSGAVWGTGQRRSGPLDARPGRAEGQTEAKGPPASCPPGAPRPSPRRGAAHQPPPPPTRLTHRRPARPRPPPCAAQQPRPSTRQGVARGATLPTKRGAWARGYRPPPRSRRGSGTGNRRGVARNHGATPPPLPPQLSPLWPAGYWRRTKEAPTLYPPQGQGRSPSPREPRHPGGRNAARPVRDTSPRRQPPASTVATTGRRTPASTQGRPADQNPGSTRRHETGQYGGHALHELSDANDNPFGARPGKAVGRTEVERPPPLGASRPRPRGEVAHRPPLSTAPPDAGPLRTHRPARKGHTTQSQARGERDRTAPPQSKPDGARDGCRKRGGARTTWKGPTRALHRNRTRSARHTDAGRGGGRGRRESGSAHTRKWHARIPEAELDQARGTHRPQGMAYQRARVKDTLTGRPATRSAGNTGREGGNGKAPRLARSAAHTRAGHCNRQGSSGAPSQAPAPRLGSLHASPWGSHWRQASSTGPVAAAPRATTH